jgi:hypothetical protein
MTQTIEDFCDYMQNAIKTQIEGVKDAPTDPPDQLTGQFPFVISYPQTASGALAFGQIEEKYEIAIEIHLARKDTLSRAVREAKPYFGKFLKLVQAMAKSNWGGNAFTVDLSNITGTFGTLDWDTTPTLGWKIQISVSLGAALD